MPTTGTKRPRRPSTTAHSSSKRTHVAPDPSPLATLPHTSSPPSLASPIYSTATAKPGSSATSSQAVSQPSCARFGSSFFLGEHEHHPQWWTKSLRRPDTFPRDDWTSATWSPPDMSPNQPFVSRGLFQWAGKFASVAVADALAGVVTWDSVGDHGLYLAIIDLMLQCRDFLRLEKSALRLRTLKAADYYISHEVWLARCTTEADRVFDLACSVLPPHINAGLDRAEALRLCLAAVVTDFGGAMDAVTAPPRHTHRVPIGFLQQYDTTCDQLAKYGVTVISGTVSLDESEAEQGRAALAWEKKHGPPRVLPNPLLGRPLAQPRPSPTGLVPDGDGARYVVMPKRRGVAVD